MTTPNSQQADAATVLIVDDNAANLGVAVEYLETHGYRVIIAQEGLEGLQRASLVQPDVILLDVMLPDESGFEICRRLKAEPTTSDIPVIFMTALVHGEHKLSGFEAGAVDYITKPIQATELIARIETHQKLRRLRQQLQIQNRQLEHHRQLLEQEVAARTAALTESNRLLAAEVEVRKRAEAALLESERQFRSLVENTPDTVARYDSQCRRVYANPKLISELGGDVETILNKTPSEFPGGDSALAYQAAIAEVLAEAKARDFELSWQSREGKQLVSYIRLTPEISSNGAVASVLSVGRDITEIDQYRRHIHRLAFYDRLTDLPNRALLVERMHQAVADAARYGHCFALMVMDLDRFKEINDTLGHGMGDLLLCAVSESLAKNVRASDTVARLGGDEFAVLLPQLWEHEDLTAMAAAIVRSFEKPFQVSGRELFVSPSLGVAVYPSDSADIDALFRYADSAMYHAKKCGGNNFQFYARELTAQYSERMTLEAALRYARANGELSLYYQPQIELVSGRFVGAEALVRWHPLTGGSVSPDKFISIAEHSGLIVGMGEWVLETACTTAAAWNAGREQPIVIAVNLSTRQFLQNHLLTTVEKILAKTGCKPQWLKLEITESLLLEDCQDVQDVLNAFDAMGLAVSIDDFGTGYSALSYLHRFPVSQIKIDRSFVRDIPGSRDKAELVKAMIFIAQALDMELVAEGVETQEQAEYLKQHGCPYAQGYLFGRPMPQSEFEAWLAQNIQ